jgi:hypothetical protein
MSAQCRRFDCPTTQGQQTWGSGRRQIGPFSLCAAGVATEETDVAVCPDSPFLLGDKTPIRTRALRKTSATH